VPQLFVGRHAADALQRRFADFFGIFRGTQKNLADPAFSSCISYGSAIYKEGQQELTPAPRGWQGQKEEK